MHDLLTFRASDAKKDVEENIMARDARNANTAELESND